MTYTKYNAEKRLFQKANEESAKHAKFPAIYNRFYMHPFCGHVYLRLSLKNEQLRVKVIWLG